MKSNLIIYFMNIMHYSNKNKLTKTTNSHILVNN